MHKEKAQSVQTETDMSKMVNSGERDSKAADRGLRENMNIMR